MSHAKWRTFFLGLDVLNDPCPAEMLRSLDNNTCAGVGARKGLYLPGWYDSGVFRIVAEEEEQIACRNYGAGYLIQVKTECTSMWQPYNVGDPIPDKALQIGVWKDGTPLYMVAKLQWNLSVATTSKIKCITYDLFSNVF